MEATMTNTQNSRSSLVQGVLDTIKELEPKYISPPPKDLYDFREYKKSSDFKQLSYDQQEKIEHKFFARSDIKEYLDQKWAAELHNNNNYVWLCQVRQSVKPEDLEAAQIIGQMISKLVQAIKNTEHPFDALRIKINEGDSTVASSEEEWEE
jgi:hypothetical protein